LNLVLGLWIGRWLKCPFLPIISPF
jgi:hypothetical protein